MRKSMFTRASALVMALLTAWAALPLGARAADMSEYSTEEFEAAYTYEGSDLGTAETEVTVEPISAMVLVKGESAAVEVEVEETELSGFASFLYYDLPVILGAAVTTALILLIKKRVQKKAEGK